MSTARTHTANAIVGTSSFCAVAAGVWIISPEIRTQIANAIAGDAGGQLTAVASRALDYGHLLLRMTRDYTPDNTPLVGFGIVALVLTFMMSRN